MAKLTTRRRKSLKKSQFALPKGSGPNRKKNQYPVDTRRRAGNAKARAKQMLKKRKLTKSQYNRVVSKANARLRRKG